MAISNLIIPSNQSIIHTLRVWLQTLNHSDISIFRLAELGPGKTKNNYSLYKRLK